MSTDNLAGEPDFFAMNKYRHFVTERESIRLKREAGEEAPWTEDEILQTYKFCNMRRRDDRVSKWIIQNMLAPYKESPVMWFMPVVARWINWPPTLAATLKSEAWEVSELTDKWFNALGDQIDSIVAAGGKAWTGAYMITARTIPPGMSKGHWVANYTLKPIWRQRDRFENFFCRAPQHRTVEEAIKMFDNQFNFGTFMAGQVVADWTYTHLLDRAPDLKTYAPIGPGSTRGLNRLYGRKLEQRIPQEQFNAELMNAMSQLSKVMDVSSFTLHDIQNTFCEYDKYLRVENGGKARTKYQPETRF
jgi:hypothetical protein